MGPESKADHTARTASATTLLLVEDEEMVRVPVAAILQKLGFRVLEAENGEAAVRLSGNYIGTIDILITDLRMPGVGGREVAAALTVERPSLRVLFTSGYTDESLRRRRLLEPGVAFLQKPFSADELIERLRALLED